MAFVLNNVKSCAGNVSDVHTTPFPHALGTRARDASGNEYVYVDYTGSAAPEMIVVITPDFTAAPVTTGSRGMIGVVPDFAKLGQSANTPTMPASYQWTSNNAGWVQIYGRAYIGVGGQDTSPSDAANGPTTVATTAVIRWKVPSTVTTPLGTLVMASGTPVVTSGTQIVTGIYIATDVTVADVSGMVGTSGAVTEPTNTPSFHAVGRTAVWLNYPMIDTVATPSNA